MTQCPRCGVWLIADPKHANPDPNIGRGVLCGECGYVMGASIDGIFELSDYQKQILVDSPGWLEMVEETHCKSGRWG